MHPFNSSIRQNINADSLVILVQVEDKSLRGTTVSGQGSNQTMIHLEMKVKNGELEKHCLTKF